MRCCNNGVLGGWHSLAVLVCGAAVFFAGCTASELGVALPEPEKQQPSPREEVAEQTLEPDQIVLPQDQLPANWEIGTAPAEPAFHPVAFEQHLPEKFRIWGAAMAPRAGRAVVTYMDTADRNVKTTYVAFMDLQRGAATVKFQCPEMLSPYAIHPSGRYTLLCRKDGVRSGRETLYLATLKPDGRIGLKRWRPLADPDAEDVQLYVKEHEVMWASFAGEEHIVTLSGDGKLYIWNMNTLQREGVFHGVKGYPALTPDQRQVAFVTGDVVVLLDPASQQVTGVHRVADVPLDPVLGFHPRGRYLAIAGKGKCTVVDVSTGYSMATMVENLHPEPGMSLKPDFGWAGRFLYANGRLFDFDSAVAIWSFNGGEAAMLRGDYLWSVVRSTRKRNDRRIVVLRKFNIPMQYIEAKVQETLRSNGGLILRPGDHVAIDVEGVPADQQKQVYEDLSANLKKYGFHPAAAAAVTARAYVDRNAVQRKTRYQQISGGREKYTLTYEERRSHLDFVKAGKVHWSDSRSNAPPYFLHEIPDDQFLSQYGGPDYKMYAEGRLPQFIRNSRHSAGRLYYRAEGFNLQK